MQLMELASHAIALDTKGVKARGPREEVVLARFAAVCTRRGLGPRTSAVCSKRGKQVLS